MAHQTILLVDDDPLLRSVIAFDLNRQGYKVLEAGSGNEALAVVNTHEVDLILSDVRMPDGDGIALLDAIKANNSRVPVIVLLTGYADISVDEAYDRGADALFAKPYDRKELAHAIAQALKVPQDRYASQPEKSSETHLETGLDLSSLDLSGAGDDLQLGRGGFFLALKPPFPKVRESVSFSIRLENSKEQNLEGQGVVRWVRSSATLDLTPGCGIEIEYLDESCRTDVISILTSLKTKPFIPRGRS